MSRRTFGCNSLTEQDLRASAAYLSAPVQRADVKVSPHLSSPANIDLAARCERMKSALAGARPTGCLGSSLEKMAARVAVCQAAGAHQRHCRCPTRTEHYLRGRKKALAGCHVAASGLTTLAPPHAFKGYGRGARSCHNLDSKEPHSVSKLTPPRFSPSKNGPKTSLPPHSPHLTEDEPKVGGPIHQVVGVAGTGDLVGGIVDEILRAGHRPAARAGGAGDAGPVVLRIKGPAAARFRPSCPPFAQPTPLNLLASPYPQPHDPLASPEWMFYTEKSVRGFLGFHGTYLTSARHC